MVVKLAGVTRLDIPDIQFAGPIEPLPTHEVIVLTTNNTDEVVRFAASGTTGQFGDIHQVTNWGTSTFESMTRIKNFNVSYVSYEDLIALSSDLGLATGDARAEIIQYGTIAAGAAALEDLIGDGVGFFDTGVVERATAFADNGVDGYLFVDVNADGDFDLSADLVFTLEGVTRLDITDIQFE